MIDKQADGCYLCSRHDAQLYLTVWPTYRKGKLRWICRFHLLPIHTIIDAQTGVEISMYGNIELFCELPA